jgi:hypothetical protein
MERQFYNDFGYGGYFNQLNYLYNVYNTHNQYPYYTQYSKHSKHSKHPHQLYIPQTVPFNLGLSGLGGFVGGHR